MDMDFQERLQTESSSSSGQYTRCFIFISSVSMGKFARPDRRLRLILVSATLPERARPGSIWSRNSRHGRHQDSKSIWRPIHVDGWTSNQEVENKASGEQESQRDRQPSFSWCDWAAGCQTHRAGRSRRTGRWKVRGGRLAAVIGRVMQDCARQHSCRQTQPHLFSLSGSIVLLRVFLNPRYTSALPELRVRDPLMERRRL